MNLLGIPSTSDDASVPFTVCAASVSVMDPVDMPPITAASLVPTILIVTTWVSTPPLPSSTSTVKVSFTSSSFAKDCTALAVPLEPLAKV